MYADDNNGELPPEMGAMGLVHIYPKYVTSLAVFHCPEDKLQRLPVQGQPLDEEHCSYVYLPGPWQSSSNLNIAIAWDKPENHGTRGLNVLFNDGHVSWLTLEEWEKIKPKK